MRLLLTLMLTGSLIAGSGETGFSFLKIGVGSRSTAMGGAAAASCSDVSAVYWNPAALALGNERQVLVAYNRWIAGIGHHFVAMRLQSAWAFHFIATGVDGIEQREIPSENPSAVFSSHDLAFGISHARSFGEQWSGGLTVKWIHERIQSSVSAVAMDLGVVYRPRRWDRWTTAMTISNLGFSGKLINERITLPVVFRLGTAYRVLEQTDHDVLASADLIQPLHGSTRAALGAEWGFRDYLFLRTGVEAGSSAAGPSAGMGFRWNSMTADYGLTFLSHGLGQAHRWSVGFTF